MSIREQIEARERGMLSIYAARSADSRGRQKPEAECDIRTVYQRDRDRIVHAKSFRRLKDKTQVFLSPQGDHYRTRLLHTLEVSQIARTAAKALALNEDLVEAIALGHDLGHTPFGHAGEAALNAVCSEGFAHAEQSLRVVDILEKGGAGLNLTWEVRDGILNHRTSGMPATLEGQVVRFCDKFAYIHHDLDDAIRAGILAEEDVPGNLRDELGNTTKERLNTMIHDLIRSSSDRDHIAMSEAVEQAMRELRTYMFKSIYKNPIAKKEETKAKRMLVQMYEYYNEMPMKMSREYYDLIMQSGEKRERAVCDYISGMTDQYSIARFQELYIPRSWEKY